MKRLINSIFLTILVIFISGCAHSVNGGGRTFEQINNYWNTRIKFKLDQPNADGTDKWQTPEETWSLKTGDCEDYAIAKYFDMVASGVDKEKLSLAWVILKENEVSFFGRSKVKAFQSHMLLIYDDGKNKWALDNYINEVVDISERKEIIVTKAIINHKDFDLKFGKAEGIRNNWKNLMQDFDKHVAYTTELRKKNPCFFC